LKHCSSEEKEKYASSGIAALTLGNLSLKDLDKYVEYDENGKIKDFDVKKFNQNTKKPLPENKDFTKQLVNGLNKGGVNKKTIQKKSNEKVSTVVASNVVNKVKSTNSFSNMAHQIDAKNFLSKSNYVPV
jgi:hypothetical protein